MTSLEPIRLHRGLVQLPPDSVPVTDPDEEVFLLYTTLQQTFDPPSGLGHVDSRKDTLSIKLELSMPSLPSDNHVKRRKGKKRSVQDSKAVDVEVELAQDKTALRSRKGDTGSVLWRASVEFARVVLQQHHGRSENSLLDQSILADSHILELGAGTGLLSILLSPRVRHYTVTDMPALIPLIRKNLSVNIPNWSEASNITLDSLDWLHLHVSLPSSRHRIFPAMSPIDLIVLVDCIYHPSLLPALLSTINHFAAPGKKTAVLVVVELRAEDVIREWLTLWTEGGEWDIWRVGALEEGLRMPFVAWVGWRR